MAFLGLGIGFIALVFGIIAILAGAFKWTERRDMAIGVGLVLVVVAFVFGVTIPSIGSFSLLDDDGDGVFGAGDGITDVCDEEKAIESLSFQTKTKYANSYTTATGEIKFYEVGEDPTDPNINPIDSSTLASGVVTDTSKIIKTCYPYQWIYDGNDTYYSRDLGTVTFDIDDLNTETGQLSYPAIEVATVGTITDMIEINETSGDVNGQTSHTGSSEIVNTSTGDALVYDESNGDGSFYLKVDFECTGANVECKDMAIEFDWDNTNPPEGNEISAITVQLDSGTDLGLPSDLVNYWANQATYL
jgi:hypothetical protein